MKDEIDAIIEGLSEAQRIGLCRQPCRSWWGDRPAAMPFHVNTGRALVRQNLAVATYDRDRIFPLTDTGLAVRTRLQEMNDGR